MKRREGGRKRRKGRKVLDLLKVPISSTQRKPFKCKILNVILITDIQ